MHDWADPYASKLLTELRKVAQPNTQLLVVDNIVAYACHDLTYDNNDNIPGAASKDAPAPLLANFGAANELSYSIDMTVSSSSPTIARPFMNLLSDVGISEPARTCPWPSQ